ncbi:unnamed protein product [Ixodes pacificus]
MYLCPRFRQVLNTCLLPHAIVTGARRKYFFKVTHFFCLQVRQVKGIALLLDVCNLDAKNPYIIQWVVLAIRNLLENNPKNQEVVAGLANKGVVTDAPQLQELGISLDLLSLTREGKFPGRSE